MRVLLASMNANKLAEVRAIFEGIEVLSPDEAGCPLDVREDGATFEDNARLKALAYAGETGLVTLADDSGLEVDALGGEPGVRSARYAGPAQDYLENTALLLEAMRGVEEPRRTARFRCVVAAARGAEVLFVVEGTVEGKVLAGMRGKGGFGYDPVFFYEPYGRTFAECTPAEKNASSHRGRAFRAARRELEKIFRSRAL